MFREIWLTPLVSVVQSVNLDSITAAAALGERRLVLFASTIHYPNHCSIQGILRCLDSYFTKFHCCTLPLRFNNFHSIRTLIVNNLLLDVSSLQTAVVKCLSVLDSSKMFEFQFAAKLRSILT